MSILYLTDQEILKLVSMPEAVSVLESAFKEQAAGQAATNSRQRLRMPGSTLHIMAGRLPGYFGYKAYTTSAAKTRFLFFLFQADTTDLLAIMEADALGQIRTGAATGLATRLMAIEDASEAALFGAGWQAQSQLVAMATVRDLKRTWIISRTPERVQAFIEKVQPLVKAELVQAASPETAVRSSQILTTITSSREPVLKGAWLVPGQHINAAGSNNLLRREVDDAAMLRADRIVVDSIEQSRIEAGEFLGMIESGKRQWQDLIELRDVVAGKPARLRSSDITLFKSMGLAMEDVAIGK